VGAPPAVFLRAKARFAASLSSIGLTQVHEEFQPEAFGSAFAEYRGSRGALRLVWDGKDGALFAYVLLPGGQWTDVEYLQAGEAQPIDRDSSDQRIERVLEAALAALGR
jgi:hypothetical protein